MRMLSAAALGFIPALLWAAPAPPDRDDAAITPAEQVRKDLDKPITLKIDKQPLSTAIDMLREKTKIHFVLDGITIQQQLGFTPDQPPAPVEIDVKDVKARAALRAVLATYGLSYAVLGDTVLVTTEDAAVQRQMRQLVSVDLDRMEFAAALKRLGRQWAVNLVLDSRVDKEAKASVSLQIDDAPLETAVRLLSEMAGLKALRVGNTLFVTRKEIAAEMRTDPDFAPQAQPALGGVYGNQLGGALGALGALGGNAGANWVGGVAGGPVFIGPTAPYPPPVPPTVPPAVGPAPAPPAAAPAPAPPPPMGGTGSAPPAVLPPAVKFIDEETAPADGGKAPSAEPPGKKEGA